MHTNDEMINALKSIGAIRTERVENAFRKVDRALFVQDPSYAYFDMALPILHGQTISAPTVVAIMLECLDVREATTILDVGSGSGYNAALLAELAGEKGKIITIEKYPELSSLAKSNIEKLESKLKNILYEVGDGSEGCTKYAPYDRIIVTAAMPWFNETHPLAVQLKPDGKLVAPIGEQYSQDLIVYEKSTSSATKVLDVVFVPLVGKYGFEGI